MGVRGEECFLEMKQAFAERSEAQAFSESEDKTRPPPKQSGCKDPVARVHLEAIRRNQGLYWMGEAGGNKQGDITTEQDASGWEEELGFVFQAHKTPFFAGCDVGGDISVIFGKDGPTLIQQAAWWKPGWR